MAIYHFTNLVCSILIFGITISPSFVQAGGLNGAQTGPPTVIYYAARDRCQEDDVPDETARAFRASDGRIVLIATHSTNRLMYGHTFLSLHHDCSIAYRSARDPDPNHHDDYGWLMAPYTLDGRVIYSLVDQEYHGSEHRGKCLTLDFQKCWENSITWVISQDQGRNFAKVGGSYNVVAALPGLYKASQRIQFGYMGPTNIVRRDSKLYFLFPANSPVDPGVNICLAQAEAAEVVPNWHFWDGRTFSFRMPYGNAGDEARAETSPCKSLIVPEFFYNLGSVSWVPAENIYLMVVRRQVWEAKQVPLLVPGAYATTSEDLIHWSAPTLILSDQAAKQPELFPSMIDPDSPGLNFDTIVGNPLLFTIEIPPGEGNAGRKLVAREVHLDYSHVEKGR